MSDWGGTTKQEQRYQTDPSAEALWKLRASLAQSIASGDWAGMQGFFDKVLIPMTKNTMTAQGLGRSGAIGEAVSQAQLGYAGQFLTSLLSGIPSSQILTGQQTKQEPGVFDWLGLIAKGVAGWSGGGAR